MNKEQIMGKISLITDELQAITKEWLNPEHPIDALEVEHYLSNIRYLTEQAAILKSVLEKQSVTSTKEVESTTTHTNFDDLHMRLSDIQSNVPKIESQPNTQVETELTLNEKLSEQRSTNSLASSLKNQFFNKEWSFSINEKLFIIKNLFNGDDQDFHRVMSHLKTLDTWDEVEDYLNAICAIPYAWDQKIVERDQLYELLKAKFNN